MDKCENRRVYRIHSRNLRFGVWNEATHGFMGIREKFGDRYVFTEYHHDADPRLGTATPLEALDVVLPDKIPMEEHLTGPNDARLQCGVCKRWAEQFRGNHFEEQGPPFYRHIDEPDGDDVCREEGQDYGRAYLVPNKALFDFLTEIEQNNRES